MPANLNKKCPVCGSSEFANVDGKLRCRFCDAVIEDSQIQVEGEPGAPKKITALLKYSEFLDDDALMSAANCKLRGIGMPKDEEEAFELYRVLAFRGNLEGMHKLAEMYIERGERDAAMDWLKIAASGGYEPSKILLKIEFGPGSQAPAKKVLRNPEPSAPSGAAPTTGFNEIVKYALPHIVAITSQKRENGQVVGSLGSGYIIDGGLIITNAHVTGEDPISLTGQFESEIDDRVYALKPIAICPDYDVAILQFTGAIQKRIEEEVHLTFAFEVEFGQDVYTIGCPLGLDFSVSKGIVSNPRRESGYRAVKEVIQADISANPGNSGGALLDMNNNIVGMLTYIPSETKGGISMAVPSSYIVEVLQQLEDEYEE